MPASFRPACLFYHVQGMLSSLFLFLLFFQLLLLHTLCFFQTFHETGFLLRFLFVCFQLGEQLIFIDRIAEHSCLNDRDQCRNEVVISQT